MEDVTHAAGPTPERKPVSVLKPAELPNGALSLSLHVLCPGMEGITHTPRQGEAGTPAQPGLHRGPVQDVSLEKAALFRVLVLFDLGFCLIWFEVLLCCVCFFTFRAKA